MTEDEAKTKWCPFARVVDRREPASFNRLPMGDYMSEFALCIGSACMAWRKDGSMVKNRRGQLVDRDRDGTGQWQDTGFCGLAGKP